MDKLTLKLNKDGDWWHDVDDSGGSGGKCFLRSVCEASSSPDTYMRGAMLDYRGELDDNSPVRSPVNVYYHKESFDSANVSGESSRRSSNPFSDFKDFVRRRRHNGFRGASRRRPASSSSSGEENAGRKASMDSQFYEMDDSDDDPVYHRPQRRFSVPERTLLNADYAILRQSKERKFEILAAFDRNTDPYRPYMQSLSCYDLAPTHGAVVLIDSGLKVRKALLALGQSTQCAAMIVHSDSNLPYGILTITDCLRVVNVASNDDSLIGERTVNDFLRAYNGRKRLVSAPAHLSIWDASRLFCLNHVHRIPIIQVNDQLRETDILYMLSLRTIVHEAVWKLIEPTSALVPHVKHRSVQEAKVGTWDNIITVSSEANCSSLIQLFVDGRVSCVLVRDETGELIGSVSKQDVMNELAKHATNYLEILTIEVKDICRPANFALPSSTVFEVIGLLLASEQQCIFVVDIVSGQPVAAIAFIDIMEYLLSSSDNKNFFT